MSNAVAAETIDYDFQDIADVLPTAAKMADCGAVQLLCAVDRVGRLESTYLGNFMVRLTVRASAHEALGFWRDYQLLNYYAAPGGELHEVAATQSEELEDCPDLPLLLDVISCLRTTYLERLESRATISHITDGRRDIAPLKLPSQFVQAS